MTYYHLKNGNLFGSLSSILKSVKLCMLVIIVILENLYELDGVVLKNIQSEKDLGVTVNHEMDWDENIKSCIC